MTSSDFPAENPRGSKNPMGAVIPTMVSSFHALRAVVEVAVWETGAKAELFAGGRGEEMKVEIERETRQSKG